MPMRATFCSLARESYLRLQAHSWAIAAGRVDGGVFHCANGLIHPVGSSVVGVLIVGVTGMGVPITGDLDCFAASMTSIGRISVFSSRFFLGFGSGAVD